MNANHEMYTSDYLLGTQSVLYAGKRLRSVLDADRATLEYAVTSLERAAQQQEGGGSEYRAFMFSGLDAIGEEDKETRERISEDVLASVLTDMQTANVLMAAGQVLGETGKRAPPHILDEAILKLDDTSKVIEHSISRPVAEGAEPGRFGFSETITVQDVSSADLPTAVETFGSYSNEALTTLVNETEGVVKSVISALSELDSARVIEAMSKLGEQMQELTKVGRLTRRGIEKLERAIDALFKLLGNDALAKIKEKVEKIWQDVKKGKYVAECIQWTFGIEATRTYIEDILRSEGLSLKVTDGASKELTQLIIKFKETMAMARGIVAAVTLAGAVLIAIPMLGTNLVLLMAFAYLMIFATVILIGMDYADSGTVLRRVRGVREIAKSIAG
jgi:hypothetical protein